MNRFIASAASAAILLATAGFGAAAAPTITQSYQLGCVVKPSKLDEQGMGDIVVRNTSAHVIPKGTKVTMVLLERGRVRAYRTETAYRDVHPGQTIEFDQRSSRLACGWAKVTLRGVADARKRWGKIVRR